MRLSLPAPPAAPVPLTSRTGRLVPALLLLPALLAGCAGAAPAGSSAARTADVPGLPSGSTVETLRGRPALGEPLRPEPGNIWADGLTPSAAAPAPLGVPGK
ncbi:hypothetical protein [Roseomonas sp. USHLN139]|uniref:hypothetical protein n=1 Tax=Roseomonas sp. USHLN139 TaxID=3081298 RepID=UPI003B01CDA7